MPDSTRRQFLETSGLGATALATAMAQASSVQAAPKSPNERLVLGFVSCGGRSRGLANGFASHADIAYACDPDQQRSAKFQERFSAQKTTTDMRHVLDDPAVDAVVISTPDHWHAPAALLACEAGKHVYIEKPCSHNFREGQLLVQAARDNNVIVQHGTQSRSMPLIVGAMQMLQEGIIGDVLVSKAWNIQRRRNIGHVSPSSPPSHLDYDAWVGPAEMVPFQSNRFHYDWHWWHNFGTGDIGNDGTHELDYARWGLGVTGLPTSVIGLGGKYYFDDDQQFPDTATCVYEWPGDGKIGTRKQLILEMRIWSTNLPYGCDAGAEFYGTKGRMFLSKKGKMEIVNENNEPIRDATPSQPMSLPANHQIDFVEAIRSNRLPTADIAIGHESVALVHLGNIAVRTGRSLKIDPNAEKIVGDEAANRMLSRSYRPNHWAIPKGV